MLNKKRIKLIFKSSPALISIFILLTCFIASPLQAEEINSPFHLSPVTDGIIAGSGIAIYGSYFLCDKILNLNPDPTPDFSGALDSVNIFDRKFANPYSHTQDRISDVLAAVTILSPAFLMCTPSSNWVTIGTMYAETALLAYSLKCAGKYFISRTRPYMFFSGYPEDDVTAGDWNDSFPSAHATMTFAAAAFSTYVFAQYFPDSSWKYGVAAISYTAAILTSAMRITSGCHYATDILAGAAIGTVCGLVIPWAHTLGGTSTSPVEISPSGIYISLKF